MNPADAVSTTQHITNASECENQISNDTKENARVDFAAEFSASGHGKDDDGDKDDNRSYQACHVKTKLGELALTMDELSLG